jgi:hypothetical protein
VDAGVTVTFDGPATVRAAKGARIDGVVLSKNAANDGLSLRCAGDLTMSSGGRFVAESGSLVVTAFGSVTVTAEADDAPPFSATGTGGVIGIRCDQRDGEPQGSVTATFRNVRFAADVGTNVDCRGRIDLDGCSAEGHLTLNGEDEEVYDCDDDGCRQIDDQDDAIVISGGTFADGLEVFATDGRVTLADQVTVRGTVCRLFALGWWNDGADNSLVIGPGTDIQVSDHVSLEGASGVSIGEDSIVKTTRGDQRDWLFVGSRRDLDVGKGTLIDCAGGTGGDNERPYGCSLRAGRTLRLDGKVVSRGTLCSLGADGDVVLQEHAAIDAGGGNLYLLARGAVVAEGGTPVVSAGDVDVRCQSGDLDLDLSSLEATSGKIAAFSNGRVRLRGTYVSARDIQVISLKDVISVAGATLRTADVTAGLSGFIRLATYGSPTTVIVGGDLPADGEDEDDGADYEKTRAASADDGTVLINASGATLRTGSSEAQSGSILLQNQSGEGRAAKASIRVAHVTARREGDEIVTRISGTLAVPRRRLDLTGSSRVAAGTVDERLTLGGRRTAPRGAGNAVSARFARANSSRPAFTFQIREPAADAGATTRVGFHRAGLHVRGSFRRPRAR